MSSQSHVKLIRRRLCVAAGKQNDNPTRKEQNHVNSLTPTIDGTVFRLMDWESFCNVFLANFSRGRASFAFSSGRWSVFRCEVFGVAVQNYLSYYSPTCPVCIRSCSTSRATARLTKHFSSSARRPQTSTPDRSFSISPFDERVC